MAHAIPYDATADALNHPARNAVYFQGWTAADVARTDLLSAEMSRLAYAPPEVVRHPSGRPADASPRPEPQ